MTLNDLQRVNQRFAPEIRGPDKALGDTSHTWPAICECECEIGLLLLTLLPRFDVLNFEFRTHWSSDRPSIELSIDLTEYRLLRQEAKQEAKVCTFYCYLVLLTEFCDSQFCESVLKTGEVGARLAICATERMASRRAGISANTRASSAPGYWRGGSAVGQRAFTWTNYRRGQTKWHARPDVRRCVCVLRTLLCGANSPDRHTHTHTHNNNNNNNKAINWLRVA